MVSEEATCVSRRASSLSSATVVFQRLERNLQGVSPKKPQSKTKGRRIQISTFDCFIFLISLRQKGFVDIYNDRYLSTDVDASDRAEPSAVEKERALLRSCDNLEHECHPESVGFFLSARVRGFSVLNGQERH